MKDKKNPKLETGIPTLPGGGYWGTPGNSGKWSQNLKSFGKKWSMLENAGKSLEKSKCSKMFCKFSKMFHVFLKNYVYMYI